MPQVDSRHFRNVLGHFLTGVTVVTVRDGHDVHGMTANAFTSVSLDPPLVLVCVGKRARLHAWMAQDTPFGVSILGEAQAPLSNLFAGYPGGDTEVVFDETFGATPVIAGALAWLDCVVESLVDAGDHTVVFARVARAQAHDGAPLAYYRGRYGALS